MDMHSDHNLMISLNKFDYVKLTCDINTPQDDDDFNIFKLINKQQHMLNIFNVNFMESFENNSDVEYEIYIKKKDETFKVWNEESFPEHVDFSIRPESEIKENNGSEISFKLIDDFEEYGNNIDLYISEPESSSEYFYSLSDSSDRDDFEDHSDNSFSVDFDGSFDDVMLEDSNVMKVECGYVIGKQVWLPDYNWHTIIVDYKQAKCLLCDDMFCPALIPRHIMTEEHKNLLVLHKPLRQYGYSATRKIREKLHCGVCNELYPENHSKTHSHLKSHRESLKFAKQSAMLYPKDSINGYVVVLYPKSEARIPLDKWNMVQNNGNSLFCVVCKQDYPAGSMMEHIEDISHRSGLVKCRLLPPFEEHTVRMINLTTFHCGACNIVIHNQHIDMHITASEHLKEIEKYVIFYEDEPRRQLVEIAELKVFNTMIYVNKYVLHTMVLQPDRVVCTICNVIVSLEKVDEHLNYMPHILKMQTMPFLPNFGMDLIRLINIGSLHCCICNVIFPNAYDYILLHLKTVRHLLLKRRALNPKLWENSTMKMPAQNQSQIEDARVQNKSILLEAIINCDKKHENKQVGKMNEVKHHESTNRKVDINCGNKMNIESENGVLEVAIEKNKEYDASEEEFEDDRNIKSKVNENDIESVKHNSENDYIETKPSSENKIVEVETHEFNNMIYSIVKSNEEEFVNLECENKYLKISSNSFNTLIDCFSKIYCLVCALNIHADIKEHVNDVHHQKNIRTKEFLKKYGENLIRKCDSVYHCAICHVVISKLVEKHIAWLPHKENLSVCRNANKPIEGVLEYAKTDGNITLNDYKPYNIYFDCNNVKLTIQFSHWESLIKRSKGLFCILCEELISIKKLNHHLKNGKHNSPTVFIKKYGHNLIREVNSRCLHCVICNRELPINGDIANHLRGRKHQRKLKNSKSLDDADLVSICVTFDT